VPPRVGCLPTGLESGHEPEPPRLAPLLVVPARPALLPPLHGTLPALLLFEPREGPPACQPPPPRDEPPLELVPELPPLAEPREPPELQPEPPPLEGREGAGAGAGRACGAGAEAAGREELPGELPRPRSKAVPSSATVTMARSDKQ